MINHYHKNNDNSTKAAYSQNHSHASRRRRLCCAGYARHDPDLSASKQPPCYGFLNQPVKLIPAASPVAGGEARGVEGAIPGDFDETTTGLVHGAGNAPGIFEIGSRAKSSALFRSQLQSGGRREFVFLPDEGILAINKKYAWGISGDRDRRYPESDGSPHSTIRSTLPASTRAVGGTIYLEGGVCLTDEMSGHFYKGWTDTTRTQFREFMRVQGFVHRHESSSP